MDIKIDDLIQKRNYHFAQYQSIDNVLSLYGYKSNDSKSENTIESVGETINSKVFPTKTRIDKQILWIFENAVSRGLKLKEVQKIYNEYVGNDATNIDNKARKLKSEGQLVVVKYNGKHVHSFWGLPSWIDGNDFKAVNRPEEDVLPNVTSSEINDN